MSEAVLTPEKLRVFVERTYSGRNFGLASTAIAIVFSVVVLWRALPSVADAYDWSSPPGGDLTFLLHAGNLISDGEKDLLYHYPANQPEWEKEHGYTFPWYYPYAPATAIGLAGFSIVSETTAFRIWKVATAIGTAGLAFVAARPVRNWAWRAAFFVAAFCWEPILLNARIGQTGIFVALAVAFGVVLFLRNRNWGAIALGILALKPTAMLGPMLMVYPERFGVWLRLFISGVIVAFAPFLWLGFGSMRHWLTILFDRASTDIAGGHYYNQGLSSLAGRSNALIIIGGCIVLIAAALLTEQVRKNLGLHASIAFAVTLGCLVNPHSLLYDWGTAFVIVFLVRKAIHLSDIPADFLSGLFMISLFVAGQLTWHYRTHDFGIQPLTAWGILVAFGILVGTFWPRKERPAEVTTTPAELQPAS